MPPDRRASFAALALMPLVLASCYNFATPSYHPADARELVAVIGRQGLRVDAATPGASACDDPGLLANAMHLEVADPADDGLRDVWVYAFREKSWDASRAPVDACQDAYLTDHPGATLTRLDIPLYRAFGPDWSPDLTAALEAGLTEASQAGGP